MKQIGYGIWYFFYIIWEVFLGTARDVRATFKHHSQLHPAIVEVPLRCETDLEIALFSAAITIPPGTAVIAIAAGDADTPASLFVHSLHQDNEHDILDDLRVLETRLLRVLRKDFVE